ncbi:hypothetical protein ASD30_25560 [Nocardioides sp. Root140]|nr:hypothetical protein ASD30_25560 [Nocardioides sp. Root140]
MHRRPNARSRRGPKGRGGGTWNWLPAPATYKATSVQLCGLWPFAGGSSRPVVGVPVGQDVRTGTTVCCDPFSWFKAGLISSPSMAVFGLQGFGKSSFAIRQILGLADRGVTPLIAGDLKGEYTGVINFLGGQVLRFGEGQRLNVLDPGAMVAAAHRLGGERGEQLRELAMNRSVTMVASLIQIMRRRRLEDWEHLLISRAVRLLLLQHANAPVPPTLPDLAHLLANPPAELIVATMVTTEEYPSFTAPLNRSLQALLEGPLGRTFSGQSTTRIDIDATAVSIDISPLQRQGEDVLSAVLVACWSETFATIEAANALSDGGLEAQRHFLTITDEMWRPMRLAGAGLVDQYDAITRLNRNDGVGNIFITHSPKDMESMGSAADNMKAKGFAERSGIVVTAALSRPDLRALSDIKPMSEDEMTAVSGWNTPDDWTQRTVRDPRTGEERPEPPPGAGKVLIKLGQRTGIQTQVKLTATELDLHDTNSRWVS